MKAFIRSFLLASIVILAIISGFLWKAKTDVDRQRIESSKLTTFVQEVLKLALLDIQVSQVFEVNKDNLRMMSMTLPFTRQKSLIMTEGHALIGYDLKKANIQIYSKNNIALTLPEPEILSLDLNHRFLFENDTFLNRITPEDRNQMLTMIRNEVEGALISETRKLDLAERVKKMLDLLVDQANIQVIVD
ncbi:MAG: DUF4230 domain-containing protein [Bdellovibrionales bacterium]|nr:DUF4230 domain-containing protein [Bdellovibrionales bacterium]